MTVESLPKRISGKPALRNYYNSLSDEVQWYFQYVPDLIDSEFPLEVCLAYAFSTLETGNRMTLYAGAVKVHKVDLKKAKSAIEEDHLLAGDWAIRYKAVFGVKPPTAATQDMDEARKTRNQIMHGQVRGLPRAKVREAIARVLHCAESINDQLEERCELKPFGNLAGFTAPPYLDEGTSFLVLKGMGFFPNEPK